MAESPDQLLQQAGRGWLPYAATRTHRWCSPPRIGIEISLVGPVISGGLPWTMGVSPPRLWGDWATWPEYDSEELNAVVQDLPEVFWTLASVRVRLLMAFSHHDVAREAR
jgi:hypothetical protein